MKIQKFEDIEAWKKARELTQSIYKVSSKDKFMKDWTLRDQIRRASISIMSNIAEGFDSGFTSEFARFLNISRRSASEVQSQLYVALDQLYISTAEFNDLYGETEEVRKMITGFIKYLRGYKPKTR
ncbi:MAG: four helix bundle protein [Candidatus Omnitrophica bacterium]|nr:four helix bundle protein [Candidatus Omnitrophota bacterium]